MNRTPTVLAIGAGCLALYGMLVLGQALVFGMASDWADATGLVRALLRSCFMTYIAVEIYRLRRWAWWLGTLVGGAFLVLLIGSLFVIASASRDGLWEWPMGWVSQVFLALSMLSLLGAVGCLLAPRSRQAVFQGRQPNA